jgi:hypothetical protein
LAAVGQTLSDREMLRAFEPVLRFTEGELFFPVAVDDYVANCELWERVPGEPPRLLLERGDVTLDGLAAAGTAHPQPGQFLRFVSAPFGPTDRFRWLRRPDRPKFRRAGRLARVGVLSRIVDALMRLSLFFRGGVAKGTEAAAETRYRSQIRTDEHPYYGRVVRDGGYVALQYWYFYVFNDWRSRAYGVNDHEADWEQVVVYLAEQPDGSTRPAWVVFSAHDETGDDLRRRWDDPDLALVGDHPVVHAGLGSHSGAYLPGEYLTTLEAPAFGGLIRFFRRISRIFLPWTRDQQNEGLGIPYVDYSRGDGLSIGAGEERTWTPVVIDDDTPWVVDYRGLWGNDTEDPFGGERAPAGPRYERSGEVRPSWGDVIGWSGLAKVAPNRASADQLVQLRLDEMGDELDQLMRDIEHRRATLRADVVSGVAITDTDERELAERVAQRVALSDERHQLELRRSRTQPIGGPHDHLHHRRLPVPAQPAGRQRLLAIWSAVSTPLILALIGLAFLPTSELTIVASAVIGVFLVFLIEAVARGEMLRFAATLVLIAIAVVVASTVAGLAVVFGWQVTVAVCFFTLALVLLSNNVRELVRD